MKISASTQVDADGWDRRLLEFKAPLFHSSVWARYSSQGRRNLEPVYCQLDRDGEVLGVALFFRHRSRNPLFRPLTRAMYSDAQPSVRDGDPSLLRPFLQGIENQALADGIVQLTIGSFGTPGNRAILEELGYTLKDRYEFILSLEKSEEEMWAGMEYRRRKHTRNAIRKAEKLGVTIETLLMEEGIAELRRLQEATFDRLRKRGSIVSVSGERASASDPIAVLIRSGHGRIIGARDHGAIVSAGLFTEMSGLAYYSLAGHAPESFETQAPTLLLWRTMQTFQAAGARWFNFGGVPAAACDPSHAEHGLYSYKEGFGGSRELCTTGTKVLRHTRQEILDRLSAARQGIKKTLQRSTGQQ